MTSHKMDIILKVNFKATPAFSAVEEGIESGTSGFPNEHDGTGGRELHYSIQANNTLSSLVTGPNVPSLYHVCGNYTLDPGKLTVMIP